jgi:hypothetical protein
MILTLKELHITGFLIEGFYLNANLQEAKIVFFALVVIVIALAIVKLHR